MTPHQPHPIPSNRRQAGFSLVEAVLCCLLVGVTMVPAIAMLGTSNIERQAHDDATRGVLLARQLLSEIVQCHYADPNADSGETRATWDDVSDYDGFTETSPTDKAGTPLSGYTGWSRSVAVILVDPASPNVVFGADVGLKKITVTATSPAGRTYTLTALRASSGAYERPAPAAGTYAASVTIVVQGSSGQPETAGVNLPNLVP